MERNHDTADDVPPLGDDWLEQGYHLSRSPISQHLYVDGATEGLQRATGRRCLLQAARRVWTGRLCSVQCRQIL